MVDISRPWVVDNALSDRFPLYTRANVGEVVPDPASPLFWTMIGGPPAEQAWRKALAAFGAFDVEEFRPDVIDIIACVHGYIYQNQSVQRVFGVRMPGASAELMDRAYFGDGFDVPPYQPHPDDAAPQYQERIMQTIGRVMATESRPDLLDDAAMAERLRADRPDFTAMTDAELVARERYVIRNLYAPLQSKHLELVYESSIVTGLLDEVLGPLGDKTLAVRLMSGLGGIASAAPTAALWRLSRLVAGSPELAAEFDAGIDGLLDRLRSRSDDAATEFLSAYDHFVYEYGSRSAGEWEAQPQTWETHPEVPLGLVGRLRLQPGDRDPEQQSLRLRADREKLTAEVRERLAGDPDGLGKFDLAMRLVAVYMPVRELSKTNSIRLIHEGRLPLRELGLRYVAAGHFDAVEDISMVREDELDALVADPASFRPVVEERWEWYRELHQVEPPYLVDGEIPPVATWSKRKAPAVNVARAGDILTGLAACPGVATGTARIISDPADADELQPGEILVAPITDPGWTPLFSSAEAVVVNVGSPLSHAAIVSRELGIPCVLAVEQATKRITNGVKLTVDGTAGTVTVH